MMLCRICDQPIPPARVQIYGERIVTCSPVCARENTRKQNAVRQQRKRENHERSF